MTTSITDIFPKKNFLSAADLIESGLFINGSQLRRADDLPFIQINSTTRLYRHEEVVYWIESRIVTPSRKIRPRAPQDEEAARGGVPLNPVTPVEDRKYPINPDEEEENCS